MSLAGSGGMRLGVVQSIYIVGTQITTGSE